MEKRKSLCLRGSKIEDQSIMKMKNIRKFWKVLLIAAACIIIAFGGFIIYWDTASPQATCASCHEIESPAAMWAESGHRNLLCKECHGTAFSNGLHSLSEKGMMIINHFAGKEASAVRLGEDDCVSILDNCKRCHGMEYAKWLSGGHSAPYSAIFLNKKHNSAVQPNADCLRCHGMFYEGTITDLISPVNVKGPWKMLNPDQADLPVIPCLACHEIHRKGSVTQRADYTEPDEIFYKNPAKPSAALYYYRYEKNHREIDDLPALKIWEKDRKVKVSSDLRQRICVQCHAPNAFHQAGTSDDRTPRGVHEGVGCLACHDRHSNDARQSCVDCHPAISNCGLDVTTMNTTFFDKKSPYNIHSVGCIDCHPKGIPKKKV
jgi:Cytochrome c3/Cytochrome c554 and c-prime